MDTKFFYDETPLYMWKDVLGESMNYAFGNSITKNAELFKDASSILDVGCGWGSSAKRVRTINTTAKIDCLSESTVQLSHIDSSFGKILADANEYVPTKSYDLVMFIQSLTHMQNSAFVNATKTTDRVFVNDFVVTHKESYMLEPWCMRIRSIDEWNELFDVAGFVMKSFDVLPLQEYMEYSKMFLDNITKYGYSGKTLQITVLESLCRDFLSKESKISGLEHKEPYGQHVFLIDLHGERKN